MKGIGFGPNKRIYLQPINPLRKYLHLQGISFAFHPSFLLSFPFLFFPGFIKDREEKSRERKRRERKSFLERD